MNEWGIYPPRSFPSVDTDVIGTIDEYNDYVKANRSLIASAYPMRDNKCVVKMHDGSIMEWEIAWPGSTGEELIILTKMMQPHAQKFAMPSTIYALKMSHRFLKNSPHFLKTMRDIQFLRNAAHVIDVPYLMKDWYKRREKETLAYPKPVLDQSKGNFFSGDGVTYVYDHDTIHLAMAHGLQPAYKSFQKDGADVLVSREKWNRCGYEIKLNSVLEETYVLALERHQIPNDFRPKPEVSFMIALEKVCTSISSGWWREFAWNNYDVVVSKYNRNYVKNFHNGVLKGTVKLAA